MSNFELLPSAVVAHRLGLSRREVVRLVERGRLKPAAKLPGRTGALLFNPSDVDALAAEQAS